jgi:prepilin-type processing-associated H-X9-DG protein
MAPSAGAGNIWDVDKNFVLAMGNYGLTAKMWFCPARPDEYTAAALYNTPVNQPINTLNDLNNYMLNLVGAQGLYVLNHNLWTYRQSADATVMIPNPAPSSTVANTDPAMYGWPKKISDKCNVYVPFVSDSCFSGYGTTVGTSTDDINITGANNFLPAKKTSGHVYGSQLNSVNLAFADGHVASHKKSQIMCVYEVGGAADWFY